MRFPVLTALFGLTAMAASAQSPEALEPFRLRPAAAADSRWLGPDLWANRLQDWRIESGAVACVSESRLAHRTAHLLTRRLERRGSGFRARLRLETAEAGGRSPSGDALGGLLLGAGGPDLDPRASSLIQAWPGPGFGIAAGVDARGRPLLRDLEAPPRAAPPGALDRSGWRVLGADGAEGDAPPEHVLDGRPETLWHTPWRREKPRHPHRIALDLGAPTAFDGAALLPRRGSAVGRIRDLEIRISDNGVIWSAPVSARRLEDGEDLEVVRFPPVRARFVEFRALSDQAGRPCTTLAELWLLDGRGAVEPREAEATATPGPWELRIEARTTTPGRLLLEVARLDAGGRVAASVAREFPEERLLGNVALLSHPGSGGSPTRFRFLELELEGERLAPRPELALGPILSAQYTLSRGTLGLTAQLFPGSFSPRSSVVLEIEEDGAWEPLVGAEVEPESCTASFRIPGWRSDSEHRFRLTLTSDEVEEDEAPSRSFEGLVRRDPVEAPILTLATSNCLHQVAHALGTEATDWRDQVWFPHADLTRRVKAQNPDLLFFAGDQIYEGRSPTAPDPGQLRLDYLYKWFLFCLTWRELLRTTPAVVIPDDHDVYQGNLWGEGGRKARRDHLGGYVHPADFVRLVERTQTSHLPEPVDPRPVAQGIGVWFTELVWGRVSFAILEDRKFKSGCARPEMPPTGTSRPDHVRDPAFDRAALDLPGLELLGARQLEFLGRWAGDWRGHVMKCALSQTHFANMATHHGAALEPLLADLDSNGWPQSGRRRALEALRIGHAVHVCGDQHLASVIQHGLDRHGDAAPAFCAPAAANFYPRAWFPDHEGPYRPPEPEEWSGDRSDGFGNRVTVHAVANPGRPAGRAPADLHDRMPGWGTVRFQKAARRVVFEAWPRYADPVRGPLYPGWPVAFGQEQAGGRIGEPRLPEIVVQGVEEPVLRVYDSASDELLWALRLAGDRIRPPAIGPGPFTVEAADPDTGRRVRVEDLRPDRPGPLVLRF